MESSDKAERGLGFEELLGAQGVASGRLSTEPFEDLVGTLKLTVQFVSSAERKWVGVLNTKYKSGPKKRLGCERFCVFNKISCKGWVLAPSLGL